MKGTIRGSELLIFEGCGHAPIYENVEEFNQKTLAFLQRHAAREAKATLARGSAGARTGRLLDRG